MKNANFYILIVRIILLIQGVFLFACGSNQPSYPLAADIKESTTVQPSHVVQRYLDQKQFQEAIWVASQETGHERVVQTLKDRLDTWMRTDSYQDVTPSKKPEKNLIRKFQFNHGFEAAFTPSYGPVNGPFFLWESEVAAYQLDQLFDLNVVPMTIPFEYKKVVDHQKVERIVGSLRYLVDKKGLKLTPCEGNSPSKLATNYWAMRFLDYLMGNRLRGTSETDCKWLYWPDHNIVMSSGLGFGFQSHVSGVFAPGSHELLMFFFPPHKPELFDFSRLDIKSRDRIKKITDAEFLAAVTSFIHKNSPSPPLNTEAALGRLHQFQAELKNRGY